MIWTYDFLRAAPVNYMLTTCTHAVYMYRARAMPCQAPRLMRHSTCFSYKVPINCLFIKLFPKSIKFTLSIQPLFYPKVYNLLIFKCYTSYLKGRECSMVFSLSILDDQSSHKWFWTKKIVPIILTILNRFWFLDTVHFFLIWWQWLKNSCILTS